MNVCYDKQPADRVIDGPWKETTEGWRVRWSHNGKTRILFVPMGRKYDGASVPRIVWSIAGIRPDGEIRAASLAHDELYRTEGGRKLMGGGMLTNDNGNKVFVDRKEADLLFRELMLFATAPRRQSYMAWWAVRLFGWKYWGKDAPSGPTP